MFEEKKELIVEYITEAECISMCNLMPFSCNKCVNFDNCCIEAEIRCNDDFNNGFAKAVNYGGYCNEEDFWEQMFN